MTKSLIELKSLVESDITYTKNEIEKLKQDKNPQIQEMYFMYKGRLEALEDILQYTKTGSKVFFNK